MRYGILIDDAQANGSTTLYIRQSDATARTLYIDGVQVEAAAAATAYCDGSLGLGYAWSGTAHQSTSSRQAGSPVTHSSASYTMAPDTDYWVGVDFRDPNNERRVNVYVGTSEADLFTSAALKLSTASTWAWPDGGGVGVATYAANARFGDYRAGSPQTADYAHRAGYADVARVAVTFSATEPTAPWAGMIWVQEGSGYLYIRNADNTNWYAYAPAAT